MAEQSPHCRIWIAETLTNLPNLLSEQEQARANKFRFDVDRDCFTQTHSALRLALSEVRPDRTPDSWRFATTEKDKPFLADLDSLHFNISHSKSCYAIAIADRPLGVDIERIGRRNDYERLLDLTTHSAERAWLEEGGVEERDFLTVWTRKEAILKATGEGVARDLTEIDTLPAMREQACSVNHGGSWVLSTRYYESCILSWAISEYANSQQVNLCDAAELQAE